MYLYLYVIDFFHEYIYIYIICIHQLLVHHPKYAACTSLVPDIAGNATAGPGITRKVTNWASKETFVRRGEASVWACRS